MAFDTRLAERVRAELAERDGVTEKQLFGGVAFFVGGNMACGVHGRELIVRLDPEAAEAALAEPNTRVFDVTGRTMRGWLLVQPKGLAAPELLARWVRRAVEFAATLPPK
jgi:TfoX/Sxy family transcriptional regulator of competence genes